MSGKQLSLDSRMDLVQRLVTDRESGAQIDESAENPSDIEETSEGTPPHRPFNHSFFY